MGTSGADGRIRGRTPTPALALVGLVVAIAAPGAAIAADEAATQLLPGDAQSAVVVDLDTDGVNELVRIVADDEDATHRVVEAWGYRDDGWQLIGSAPIPKIDPTGADTGNVLVDDASGLIVSRADGRAGVLVLVSCCGAQPAEEMRTCCLAAFELVRTADAVALEARLVNGRPADLVQVIDIDADGTDELMRSATSGSGETGEIEVLRRDGDAFTSVYQATTQGWMAGIISGDSDGVAGQDIIIGPTPDGNLRRIAWADGSLRAEEASIDLGERSEGYITSVARDAILLSLPNQLQLVRWPRGGQPVRTARIAGLTYPYGGIVESGSSAIIAVQAAGTGMGAPTQTLGIYDLDLRELGQIEMSPISARVERLINASQTSRNWERYLFSYSGPLEAASPGAPHEFVWGGVLVRPGGGDGYLAQPIAPLLGLQSIGAAGPDDGWVVLSSGYSNTGGVAYLYAGFVPPGFGRISLAPIEQVLRPDGVAPVIELRNAVSVGSAADDVTQLVADREGFEVVVRAPVGSWVVAFDGRSIDELTVDRAPLIVEIAPPPSGRQDDEDKPIDASLIVATPDGHATVVEWTGTFVSGLPALSVSGRTEAFAFGATLEGTVGPHTTVSVDGRPVAIDADGGFVLSVEAGPWPRDVLVSARDPLGNEVLERLEVLGVFDYRGLPWAAIVAAATVGVGAVLFVRIPRRRLPATDAAGDGRLEELDPIDGTDFGKR